MRQVLIINATVSLANALAFVFFHNQFNLVLAIVCAVFAGLAEESDV